MSDRGPVAGDGDGRGGGGDRAVDALVAQVLGAAGVPEHAPGFWERLEERLAGEAARWNGTGAPTPPPLPRQPGTGGRPEPAARRWRWARAALAAAAAVTVLAASAALVVSQREPGIDMSQGQRPAGEAGESAPVTSGRAPAVRPDEAPPRSTTPPGPAPGPATPAPPTGDPAPGAAAAVAAFLDALGRGDLERAASLVGPLSEAHLDAAGSSVEAFVREAAEGFGAWAGAADRTLRTIELRDGEVVVVVSGVLQVEGVVEDRDNAFPARYAESARAWFVEPVALAQSARAVELLDPAPGVAGPRAVDQIGRVVAAVPGAGTAWLSVDGGSPVAVTTGPDGGATWVLPEPLPAGRHSLVAAFVGDDAFDAAAASFVVRPP